MVMLHGIGSIGVSAQRSGSHTHHRQVIDLVQRTYLVIQAATDCFDHLSR
jgi:hypothetical protein